MATLCPARGGHADQVPRVFMFQENAFRPFQSSGLGRFSPSENYDDCRIKREKSGHSFAPVFFPFSHQFFDTVNSKPDRKSVAVLSVDLREVCISPFQKIKDMEILNLQSARIPPSLNLKLDGLV